MTQSEKAPVITVTPAAAKVFEESREDDADELHLGIMANFEHSLFFAPRNSEDIAIDAGGVTLLIDAESARRASGIVIDFVPSASGGGFSITNPNEPAKVKQLTVAELKKMLDAGTRLELLDVRTAGERATASIAGSRFLDQDGLAHVEGLDKKTTLVLHCHHGMRSQVAAERLVRQGFTDVYNLRGGIDAWSTMVDPSVPRY